MTKFYLPIIASAMAVAASAQSTADAPATLLDGENTITVNWDSYRQVAYYTYTSADQDQLLSLTIPTANAAVVASSTKGDKTDSDISNYCLGDNVTETTGFKCLAPKGEPVYLKVTIPNLALPMDAETLTITASAENWVINYGLDCSDPIQVADGEPTFLPLTAQTDPPFLLNPVYVAYTAQEAGWLYLNFAPSVTKVEYASSCDGTYATLKHEYLHQDGKTVGARAKLEVEKDEPLIFRISGFSAVMLSTAVMNPEEGTSCDFPLDITPGVVTLPAEAGDYYWHITPQAEGMIEITSDRVSLAGGLVEVMMDCQGTSSFTINGELRLRSWVYDRMEYLIHVHKAQATESAEQFDVAINDPMPCDVAYNAPELVSGETYETIPFAGIYYYKIVTPPTDTYILKLTTLKAPAEKDTRANLFLESDLSLSVARGLDMTYTTAPSSTYILQWTVFDNDSPIPFKVNLDKVNSAADIEATPAEISIYSIDGLPMGKSSRNLAPGIYIRVSGDNVEKVLVK